MCVCNTWQRDNRGFFFQLTQPLKFSNECIVSMKLHADVWNPKLDRCCAQSYSCWFSVCCFSENQLHAGPERALLAVFKVLSWKNSHISHHNLLAKFTAKVKDVRSSVNSVDARRCKCTFSSKTKGNIGWCLSNFLVWTHKPLLCLLAARTAAKESLQASSWAPSLIKEACICRHRAHRTLSMLRKGEFNQIIRSQFI